MYLISFHLITIAQGPIAEFKNGQKCRWSDLAPFKLDIFVSAFIQILLQLLNNTAPPTYFLILPK